MKGALHVVQGNILREIQYFVREELLRQLLLLQVCQRTRFSGLEREDAMTFWIAFSTALRFWNEDFYSDLSSKGGVKILSGIALRDQRRCTVLISPSIICGWAIFDVERL